MDESKKERRWDYAAGGLLAVTPLAGHLLYHDFKLLSIDAAALVGIALGLGLAVGWLIQNAPPVVRTLILGVATIAFLDLAFNVESTMSFRVVVAGGFLVAWLLKRHYTQILTLSVGAVLLSLPMRPSLSIKTWTPAVAPQSTSTDVIPIVHIVLDEHSGVRGFPSNIPEAARAREVILEFYRRHGFRLYVNAYSEYSWTQSSLPAVMGPARPDGRSTAVELGRQHHVLSDNQLFRWASGRGYQIHVLQTSYLDFCHPPAIGVVTCRTYPANTLSSLRVLPLALPRRILLEAAYFLSVESHLVRRARNEVSKASLARLTETDPGNTVWLSDGAGTGMALASLAELRMRTRAAQGSYHFGHFLTPHAPYEVDRECRGLADVRQRLSPVVAWSRRNSTESRRIRWVLYAGQIECLYRHLDSVIARLDSAAAPLGVMILIHGDHGSRIVMRAPEPANAGRLQDQDFLDAFSTLLAVRGPGIREGLDSSAVSIQSAVPRLLANQAASYPGRRDSLPMVFLEEYRARRPSPLRVAAPVFLH